MSNGNQTSLLAKLLATENITVQHQPGIKTAMFDLKGRVLMLPLWQNISQDLQDLLIVHETGHALDTPQAEQYAKAAEDIAAKMFPNEKISETLKTTVRGFLNVIEDARIDKRQKRRYPGSRKNYLIGYRELMDRDFFGTAKRDINTMNFIDRLNIYFKGGNIHYKIEFSPEERVFVKKAESLETFEEVVDLTEKVYAYCKQKLENQQTMELDLFESEEGEEDEYSNIDNDFDGDADSDETDDASTKNENGTGEGKEDESSELTQGEGDIASPSGHGNPNDGLPENAPVSSTDETWQRRSEEIVKNENCSYVYLNMPQVNWDKALHDYKKVLNDWRNEGGHKYVFEECRKNMSEWKQKEKETISFLVKEFEAKKAAEMYARINVSKTGVIDTNKLHSYKYNDDIFRRLTNIPKGKNHGFIMFLDWSGSMQGSLKETIKQLFSLCLFCKQIGVPFEVYAFKDCGADNPFTYINQENVIGGSNLVLRNFLSSRMNVEEMNFAMTMLWAASNRYWLQSDSMGGTPLNNAIMIAPKIINDFREKNKLEIVNTIFLTDGGSNGADGVQNETINSDRGRVLRGGYERRYFYVDPVTKKTYDWYPWGWSNTEENTNTLLRILKDRTGCNLVGFFLYEYSFKKFVREFRLDTWDDRMKEVQKFWNENKFYPVMSAGYDEYYIIDTKAMRNTTNELLIDNTGDKKMTTKRMASAFSKFAQKKSVNRVLLRKFVDKIAGQSKKTA